MATLESTQSGSITAGATYVGGAAPSDDDTVNLNHDHTLEANFTQTGTIINVKDNASLDTRNAADSTNYALDIKQLRVYDAEVNFRDGTHKLRGDGATGWGLYTSDFDSNCIMAGCTLQVNAFYLKGNATMTGSNTMQWGTGEVEATLNIGGSYWYGNVEGSYNDGNGWEDATRLHLDCNGAGDNSGQSIQMITSSSVTDGDGPVIYHWASFKLTDWNGQIFRFNNVPNDTEWAFDNAITLTWGRGEHGTTSNSSTANQTEGNFTCTDSSYFLFGGWSSSTNTQIANWIYGDLRIGTETELSDGNTGKYHCGSFKTSSTASILNAYTRVDGDLIFDGDSTGKAQMHLPNFTYYKDDTPDTAAMDPDLTASDRVHGALMVFGDVTGAGVSGRFYSYDVDYTGGHNNATVSDQEVLWVFGIDSGTWNIVLGENNDQSGTWPSAGGWTRGPFTGSEDLGAGTFTYSNWEERAVSYLNPSGITLGTKPDSGSDSIRLLKPGDRTAGCNLIFDENAAFADITIDADTTITVNDGITVTYTGTLTNNGTLTETGTGSMELLVTEVKSHSSFGRGDGGKTSFQFESAQDLDQTNWVESYFLDQDNRLG